MPEVLAAAAVYVTLPAPWQRLDVAPRTKLGVLTIPLIVTVCVADFGPLQPVAVAVIVDVPIHNAANVTVPVAALIVLPPNKLAPSRLYVSPVLLVAVAV